MIGAYYKEKTDYAQIGGGRLWGIKKLLGDYSGGVILDIGCGQGVLGRSLKQTEASVTVHGVDISPRSVAIAKQFLDKAYCFDIESGEQLAELLQTSHYDTIIISEVLEHLFYPEKILETIHTNIRPNTRIIITVPNILFWKNRLKICLGWFEYANAGLMDRGHIHFFSWKSFEKMIIKEQFIITDTAHNMPTPLLAPLGRFTPGLAAFQFIVKIQKV